MSAAMTSAAHGPMLGPFTAANAAAPALADPSAGQHASPSAASGAGTLADASSPAGADAPLAARAASGDTDAFGQLVRRYQRPMAAVVSRMIDNPDDVDDVVQELFIRAWKGLPRFRGDAQFSTWLYRIAVNTAIKRRSAKRRDNENVSADALANGVDGPAYEAAAPEGSGADPYAVAQRKEQEAVVRSAVLALPEKQRVVVVLHYFEGRSCEEISEIVGCSVGTVWSRLHYACKRLKGTLGPMEGLA